MYVGGEEDISRRIFFFPKHQGQAESTPRVVGGKTPAGAQASGERSMAQVLCSPQHRRLPGD